MKRNKFRLFILPALLMFSLSSCTYVTLNRDDPFIPGQTEEINVLVSISASANKIFYIDDEITINDFKVTATYVNEKGTFSTKVVTGAKITNQIDTSESKRVTVYISYSEGGVTANTSVSVLIAAPNTETSLPISLEATPVREFYLNDVITIDDFSVKVTYDDNSINYIEDATITNQIDTSTPGEKLVSFSYTESEVTVTCDIGIEINNEEYIYPVSMELSANREFYVGDIITVSDFTVLVTFSDESSNYVTDAVIGNDLDTSETGEICVTIDYERCGVLISEEIYVMINELDEDVYPVGLEVTTDKTFYVEDTIYPSDFTVTVLLSNNNQFVTSEAYFAEGEAIYLDEEGQLDIHFRYDFDENYLEEVFSIDVVIYVPPSYKTITIEPANVTWPKTTYNTGNYFTSSHIDFNRVVDNGSFLKLLPANDLYMTGHPGSISNTSAIKNIHSVSITYKTSGSESMYPAIYLGEHNYYEHFEGLTPSSSVITEEIVLDDYQANYFLLSSGSLSLYVSNITINYLDTETSGGSNFVSGSANDGELRAAPTVFEGELVPGVSNVDVPIQINESTFEVEKTKTYTYYSYEYVYNHPEVKSDAAMIDPVDVCNYYLAFGCAPANYGKIDTVSPLEDGLTLPSRNDVNTLFGSDARVIQQFSRTDGYAKSVPYYGSKPIYYEFDVNSSGSYSTTSRQVGRVVAWKTGFKGNDYGNGSQAVCVFTDDHYSTFREFNNIGGFMPAFDAELHIVGKVWSNPTTIELESFSGGGDSGILDDATLLNYSSCDAFTYYVENNGLSSMNLYLLSSGQFYNASNEYTFTSYLVSEDTYYVEIPFDEEVCPCYVSVNLTNGTVTNLDVNTSGYPYGVLQEEIEVATGSLQDIFEDFREHFLDLGYYVYTYVDDGAMTHTTGSEYEYYTQYLSNSKESVVIQILAIVYNDTLYLEADVYGCEDHEIQDAQSEIPDAILEEVEFLQEQFSLNDDQIYQDNYAYYGNVTITFKYQGDTETQQQEVFTVSFLGSFARIGIPYNSSYLYLDILTTNVGDNTYSVTTPFGEYQLYIDGDSVSVTK